jgi:hypothetical protein
MSGTPSRTATACPRGHVGRKLKANPRPEEHKLYTRHRYDGRGGVGIQSPMTSGSADVDAAVVGRKSRVLPWEICRAAPFTKRANTVRAYRPTNVQALDGSPPHLWERMSGASHLVDRAREVARPTEGAAEVSRGHTSRVQAVKGRTQGRT